jgi:protein-glutamine gamma-glutamyltransferase
MAGLATIALEQAMLEPGRSRALTLALTAGLFIIPGLVAAWLLARNQFSSTGREPASSKSLTSPAAGVALVSLFAVPFIWEVAHIVFAGRTAMVEVTLMAALRNLGLGLAAMAHWRVYARLSALVSLFLVTVASSVGGESGMAVLAPVGGFALTGTLLLILVYWEGLGLAVSAGSGTRRLPITAAAWVLGIVAAATAFAAIGPSRAATALAGLVPTSGGTDWSDPEARSGVGDGDNEVKASEHPQSVGFAESEIYLETDRPSLYDSFNESYGEPLKPKKQEKMIALGLQDVSEQKERPAENLRSGREFSAVRRKPVPRPKRPTERAARALVYVKGPTPLHLPLTSYCLFDGTTWREEPCCNRHFPAEAEPRSSWLRLPVLEAPFFAGTVVHQVKVGTLESSPMPVPPHVLRFRVGSVNRLDFFGWAQFGIIRMTDRAVPAGTVIDCEAHTVDPETLRSGEFKPKPGNEDDQHVTFLGDYAISPTVASLARGFVAGVPEGWCQVEAVIAAIRRRYSHDRAATTPPDCTDVVADFLLKSHRGPDYLFASSAAVLLRSLGYPTRVVSGLYAAPEHYDARMRHTPVTAENVHFWAEVRMPDGLWVAIEPTPGYDLMPASRSWSQLIATALAGAGSWAQRHAALVLATAVGLMVVVLRRHILLDRLATIAFGLIPEPNSRRFVMRTLKLIERRARWAGCPRPPGLTLGRWYFPVARQTPGEPRVALEGLIALADWAIHAPDRPDAPPPGSRYDIQQTCQCAVKAWTLVRFRQPVPSRS